MTKAGLADAEKMLTMDDDVERRRAAEELERMEESIKFEAEASVESADAKPLPSRRLKPRRRPRS